MKPPIFLNQIPIEPASDGGVVKPIPIVVQIGFIFPVFGTKSECKSVGERADLFDGFPEGLVFIMRADCAVGGNILHDVAVAIVRRDVCGRVLDYGQ